MVGQWVHDDVRFRVGWCNFLGINKVLDRMAKAGTVIGFVSMALVLFAVLGRVMVFG